MWLQLQLCRIRTNKLKKNFTVVDLFWDAFSVSRFLPRKRKFSHPAYSVLLFEKQTKFGRRRLLLVICKRRSRCAGKHEFCRTNFWQ